MTDFLWGPRPQPARGPRPALTLERIADAAVSIADAEGLAAVSMQRVAADLGFTKMSLYRYLPGKTELVALMVERAVGAPPAPESAGPHSPAWRDGLKAWAHGLLGHYQRHPWLLEAVPMIRPLGPGELGWMESAMALLDGTGLTAAERLDTMAVLAGQVRVIAQQTRESRQPEAHVLAAIWAALRDHGDRFPAMSATMAEASAGGGQDQAFDFGLERILDGLQALIDHRSG